MYWRSYHSLIAPSYQDFIKLMRINLGGINVIVGLEWEHGPMYIPILLQRIRQYSNHLFFKYAVSVYLRSHIYDSSDPDEFVSVPPVPFNVDGSYALTPLIRQTAFLAVLDMPNNYCSICGRHIHLSLGEALTGAGGALWKINYFDFSKDEQLKSLQLSEFHKLMYSMASRWVYDKGSFKYGFRPYLIRYATMNKYINDDHYSAVNINYVSWPKPVTIEIRYNEVVPLVSLPAIIYAVEYLIRRNTGVITIDPHSDEYFDTAIKLCNNPLCAEIIRSVRDYVVDKKSVYWDWISVREALGHIIDDQLYRMLDYIHGFMDEVPETTVEQYADATITYIGFDMPTTCSERAKAVKPFKSFVEFIFSESVSSLFELRTSASSKVNCYKLVSKGLVEE